MLDVEASSSAPPGKVIHSSSQFSWKTVDPGVRLLVFSCCTAQFTLTSCFVTSNIHLLVSTNSSSANHAAAIECILLCRRGDDDLPKNAFISHIGGSICTVTATCLQEEVLNVRKVQDCLMILCPSLCIRLLLILTCVEAALLLLLFSLLGGLQAFPPLQKKMWFLFLFFFFFRKLHFCCSGIQLLVREPREQDSPSAGSGID